MARTTARGSRTHGQHHPHHLHQIVGLRVIEVQCQLLHHPHQCHQGPVDLGAPGICTKANSAGSEEAIWKSICQSSRMRTQRTLSLIKVGIGTQWCTTALGVEIAPSSLCYPLPTRLSRELVRSLGTDITLDGVLTILDEHYNVKTLDALNQELFQLQMAKKETVSDWGVCLSRYLQIFPASLLECFPPDNSSWIEMGPLLWGAA